jgi:protein tyrosine/serine phosphatase
MSNQIEDDDEAVQQYMRTNSPMIMFRQSKYVCGHCNDKRRKTLNSMKQHWADRCKGREELKAAEAKMILEGITSEQILANCVREVCHRS